MKTDYRKSGCFILLALMLVFGLLLAAPVQADADRGSITINLNDIGSDRTGVEFQWYQAAVPTESNEWSWQFTAAFKGAATDLNTLDKAADYKKAAEILVSWKGKKSAATGSGKTDQNGVLAFENLPFGIYLIEQTDRASYGTVQPFLVAVPSYDGGELLYDVVTNTKGVPPEDISQKASETETPDSWNRAAIKDTGGQKKKSAKTGDPSRVEYFAMAAILAAAVVVLLIYQKKKRTKKHTSM